ncbi:bifunctional NAD(P)H-hydrate repair enzyme Nnr [archaeon BMS3Abin16]|nr:bifunctional NAD(P)H-hydrate repair enzyme Nnr [archaeon BMS3Abin16]HDY73687.1 NAD(P)H-hydrate epimerase [Euryarchaeota archaeon]
MRLTSVKAAEIPALTTEQMREVDRLMVEKYGVQIIQMMENAGRNLASLIRMRLGGSVAGTSVAIAVGGGNNGGGGMVAARHLYNMGCDVTVLVKSENLTDVPKLQWNILRQFPVKKRIGHRAVNFIEDFSGAAIVDSLIGYGLRGAPRGWTREIIDTVSKNNAIVVALDVPTGLDSTTGEVYDTCIRADSTMTLALPKTGLLKAGAQSVVGRLYLADIGVPDILYQEIDLEVPQIFNSGEIIRLDDDYEGGHVT